MDLLPLLKKIYNILPCKRAIFILVKSFYKPPHQIYKHLHFKGWFKIKVNEVSFQMYHYGFEIENEIFWQGINGWEKNSFITWIKLSEISEVVIDIGSNTGIFALFSKAINPTSKVYTYEPVKRVYEKLVINIRKNNFDIKAEEIAISNSDGKAIIYDQPTEHIYSVTVNENLANENVNVIPTTISTKRLDTIIEEEGIKRIDLIKIDVETHEAEVLEGMGKYLKLFKPILLIEILTDKVAEKVNSILKDLEYIYYSIDEVDGLEKMESIRLIKKTGYNYLAFPKLKMKEIENFVVLKPNPSN